jgi:hypothetical protein
MNSAQRRLLQWSPLPVDAAFAEPLALRAGASRVFQPDRPVSGRHYWRTYLRSGVRGISGLFPGRSRSALHAERGLQGHSSGPRLRRLQRLLRLGLYKRLHRSAFAIHRQLSAGTYHRRPDRGQAVRREVHGGGQCAWPIPGCCWITASPSVASTTTIRARSTGRCATASTSEGSAPSNKSP